MIGSCPATVSNITANHCIGPVVVTGPGTPWRVLAAYLLIGATGIYIGLKAERKQEKRNG